MNGCMHDGWVERWMRGCVMDRYMMGTRMHDGWMDEYIDEWVG